MIYSLYCFLYANMQRLKYSEFVPFASSKVDVEVRVHHCKSGPGNDKLFIRRTQDGAIIGHCKHCGMSGYYRSRQPTTFQTIKERYHTARQSKGVAGSKPSHTKGVTHDSRRVRLPADAVSYSEKARWSVHATRWIEQYGLTQDEITRHGISYSPRKNRIYFPVYYNGEFTGFQSRRVENDGSAKWLSIYLEKQKFFVMYPHPSSTTVVIVEDIVSGILCSRHHNVYVCLGTYISDLGMNKLVGYDKYLVFLDDDKPQVKMNQLKLKRQLQLLGPVDIIHAGTDPKNLSTAALSEALT